MNMRREIPVTEKKCNSSVVKCLKILECFTEDKKELKLTEIAKMLSIPKSTAYNLLTTLKVMGYVFHSEDSGKYSLGSMLMVLGKRSESNYNLRDILYPYLRKLRAEFDETFNATICYFSSGKINGTWLLEAPTSSTLAPSRPLGSEMELHCAASGQVFLAYASEDIREKTLDSMVLTKYTEYTITDRDTLLKRLSDVRREGYAIALNEEGIGIMSIAAPVFDNHGRVIACLSSGIPTVRAGDERIREIKSRLLEYSRQASSKYRGNKLPV